MVGFIVAIVEMDTEWFEDLERLYVQLGQHLLRGMDGMMAQMTGGLPSPWANQPASLEACYQVLGLSPEATLEEVKRRYRDLAKRLHPDVAGPETSHLFHMVTQAYEQIRKQKEEHE